MIIIRIKSTGEYMNEEPLSSNKNNETTSGDAPSSPDTSSSPEVQADTPITDAPLAPAKKSKHWAALLVVIVLLVAGITAALVLTKKDKTADKNVTAVHKDIPVFRFGSVAGDTGKLYPENSGTAVFETSINAQVYEPLVHYENLTKIVPSLAQSWKNPDDTTWVFTLKKDIKFHSGKTLTAADVKFSLDEIKKNEDVGGIFATTIKEVTAINDNEVKIVTDGPDPLLLNRLAYLYIVDSTATKSPDTANGTGPYVLKPGTEYTATNVKLAAFDGYHGGHVGVREIEYIAYDTEDALLTDINSGKLDMANDLSKEGLGKISSTVASPQYIKTNYVDYIRIDHSRAGSPVQKLGVRQAMWESLDQKALLKANGSEGEVATQIVPRDIPGYDTSIKAPERNTTKAKADLKEAGYPDGATIQLTYFKPYSEKLAIEIQKQLKEGGITIKLDPQEEIQDFIAKRKANQTELTLNAYASDVLDVVDVASATFTGNNLYSNPKVEQLIAEANKTLDASKRLATTKEISRILMKDIAWVPLYTASINSSMTKKNYVLNRDFYGDLGYYFWKGYSQ